MDKSFFRTCAFTLVLGAALTSGCSRNPGAPTPTPTPTPSPAPSEPALSLTRVNPTEGWPFYFTEIVGTGIQTGARLTIGGVDTPIYRLPNGTVYTIPPWREPGTTVDLVITNPDGVTATLTAGFTYKAATLELSKSVVDPGDLFTVSWSGPHDPSDFTPPDTVGLYAVGDPSNTVLWYEISGVGERFSAQFKAPVTSGAYEVRYLMLSKYLLAKVPLIVR